MTFCDFSIDNRSLGVDKGAVCPGFSGRIGQRPCAKAARRPCSEDCLQPSNHRGYVLLLRRADAR